MAVHGFLAFLACSTACQTLQMRLSCGHLDIMERALIPNALRPEILPWPRGEAVHVSPLVSLSCTSGLPSLLGSPHEHCKVVEDFEISHGVSFAAN